MGSNPVAVLNVLSDSRRQIELMRIYFDTSAINAITDDSDKPTIVRKLTAEHEPLLSSLTLTEMVSTIDNSKRLKLLIVASRLSTVSASPSRRLLVDEQDMLRRSLDAFVHGTDKINYFKSKKNFPELFFLLDPYCVLDKTYTEITREWSGGIEHRHHESMSSMRAESQETFKQFSPVDKALIKQGRAAFLRHLVNESSLLTHRMVEKLADSDFAGLNNKVVGRELDVLLALDAWRFSIASTVIQIYNRLIKESGYGRRRNPGWVDTKQSVYLAAADVFVTEDVNQRNMLRLVARFGRTPRKVWSYRRLRTELGL